MSEDRPTYLVTGATGGIGRCIVEYLAQKCPCRIVLAVRNVAKAKQMADEIGKLPGCEAEFNVVKLDLESLSSVADAVQSILSAGWSFDAIVNNAGIMPGETIVTKDGYELATQVNYVSTKQFAEGLLPAVKDGGAIVFTTSVTRYLGKDRDDWEQYAINRRGLMRRFYVYGQAKRMIAKYANNLAKSAEVRHIRVNCADPGIVDTNMITLGNRVVDFLATAFFRPFITKAKDGAKPAILAMESELTGQIYTRKGPKENTF